MKTLETTLGNTEKEELPEKLHDMREIGSIAMNNTSYRTEHSRSLEDAEIYKAQQVLIKMGLLIPVADLDVYHGRVAVASETVPWSVDPYFANGGNDSGNDNVYAKPTLYTSDQEIAGEFAERRLKELSYRKDAQSGSVETHKIVSRDPDAVILNAGFSFKGVDLAEYSQAMMTLLPKVSSVPVGFGEMGELAEVKAAINQILPERHKRDGVDTQISSSDMPMEKGSVAEQVAGAVNARYRLIKSPGDMVRKLVHQAEGIVYLNVEGESSVPLSMDYVAQFLKDAHIIGKTSDITSATLGKDIEVVSFLDLTKVNAPDKYDLLRNTHKKYFEDISERMTTAKMDHGDLAEILDNPYATPQAILGAAKKIEGFKVVFEADAGNWEGYTLEEHTETVLRNLDENFADKLPVPVLKLLRLAVVVHDIGKPNAAAKNEKYLQKEHNVSVARQFFGTLKLDAGTNRFLTSLIGEGMDLAGRQIIRGDASAGGALRSLARDQLQDWLGEEPDEDVVKGYVAMARILVTCDGGAYTTMAVTRKEGGYHRNAGSFDKSFYSPASLTKTDISFRR